MHVDPTETMVAEFAALGDANRSLALLRAGGFYPQLTNRNGTFVISVPGDKAYDATQFLQNESRANTTSRSPLVLCPECGGFQTRKLAPYSLIALCFSIAISITLYAFQDAMMACLCFLVGWFAMIWFSRLSGKRRCDQCGWIFS